MEYAKILQKSAGKFDYRESPLNTQMKVNELRKTINKDGRANIIKQEPYANKISTYLSKEELSRKMNEGATRYKMGVQDEYDNLVLGKLKNRKDDEFMKTAKKQSEFMKLLGDPAQVDYLKKVDPFGLFILRERQEKDKLDFVRENEELKQYKELTKSAPERAVTMYQFTTNPLIKLFGSHPEDDKLVDAMTGEVGNENVARRIVAHSGIDATADEAGLSDKDTASLHSQADDQMPITDPNLTVGTFPLGSQATFSGSPIARAPVVPKQTVETLSSALGPAGPITYDEALNMTLPELKRYVKETYKYEVKEKTKENILEELQDQGLVRPKGGIDIQSVPSVLPGTQKKSQSTISPKKGLDKQSLPSSLPEDEELDEDIPKKKESKEKIKKTVIGATLLSLFQFAKKDLEKMEEDHIKEIEKAELEKQKKKVELSSKLEGHRKQVEKNEETIKKLEQIASQKLEAFKQITSKSGYDVPKSVFAQKEYDDAREALISAEKVHQTGKTMYKEKQDRHLKDLEELEQKHLTKMEELQKKHREKVSKYAKGKGFKPLSSFPKHIVASALHKNYLRYRHLIPNQNEYNREQARNLLNKVLKK